MNGKTPRTAVRITLTVLAAALVPWPAEVYAAGDGAGKGGYVDVRTYLPQGYVTDGSVDYRVHIQKCFDENAYVYFPGGDDPAKPMIYGSTAGLKTRPFSVVRFGTNAILKRLPCFNDLLVLGRGTHLIGAVIDGNKYAHWPLMKDREIRHYAYVAGNGIVLGGQNVIKDCFVFNLAGIAFGGWNSSDNKIYRSRAENCGFLEAMGSDFFSGEYAPADGFYFSSGSRNNIIKDCEAYDCSRWGFVLTEGTRDNTIVDCRGGNIHFKCYGFIDVEGNEYANSLVRCRSHNSHITVQGSQNDLFGCVASHINAQDASFVRIIACTTTGGRFSSAGRSICPSVTPSRAPWCFLIESSCLARMTAGASVLPAPTASRSWRTTPSMRTSKPGAAPRGLRFATSRSTVATKSLTASGTRRSPSSRNRTTFGRGSTSSSSNVGVSNWRARALSSICRPWASKAGRRTSRSFWASYRSSGTRTTWARQSAGMTRRVGRRIWTRATSGGTGARTTRWVHCRSVGIS